MRDGAAGLEMSNSDAWTPRISPGLGVGVLAHAQQPAVAHGVQVGRVAGDLQLAEQRRRRRVGQVDEEERVGLAERHDRREVAEVAHRVDLLGRAQPLEAADLGERVPVGAERVDRRRGRLACHPLRIAGHGRAQDAVLLVQRELVEEGAGDGPGRDVAGGRRVGDVEAVQVGGDLLGLRGHAAASRTAAPRRPTARSPRRATSARRRRSRPRRPRPRRTSAPGRRRGRT